MFDQLTLIIVNSVCIFFMVTMLFVLGAATRMKGGAGWAAIFIFTNLPVILANLILEVAPQYYLYIMYPAYSINMLWFPSMWFFT